MTPSRCSMICSWSCTVCLFRPALPGWMALAPGSWALAPEAQKAQSRLYMKGVLSSHRDLMVTGTHCSRALGRAQRIDDGTLSHPSAVRQQLELCANRTTWSATEPAQRQGVGIHCWQAVSHCGSTEFWSFLGLSN